MMPMTPTWASMGEGYKFRVQLSSAPPRSLSVASPTSPNPSHIPVHTEDCVIMAQSFTMYGIP